MTAAVFRNFLRIFYLTIFFQMISKFFILLVSFSSLKFISIQYQPKMMIQGLIQERTTKLTLFSYHMFGRTRGTTGYNLSIWKSSRRLLGAEFHIIKENT